MPGFAFETAWNPERIWMPACRQRSDDECVSKRVGVDSSSSRSSPRFRNCFAASAQPDRGFSVGVMMTAPCRARTSTSSVRPASSIRGLGSRTPRELPIRTRRAFISDLEPPVCAYNVVTAEILVKWRTGRLMTGYAAQQGYGLCRIGLGT